MVEFDTGCRPEKGDELGCNMGHERKRGLGPARGYLSDKRVFAIQVELSFVVEGIVFSLPC